MRYAVVFVLGAVWASVALSQDRLQPLASAKPPEYKSLIVETVHPYRVREYVPPLVLATDVTKAATAFDHPERTLAAYFSAMARGSYSDFLSCWTADSVSQLEAVNKKLQRSPDQWQRIWAETISGRKVVATHWINYGRYILVNYRIEQRAPSVESPEAVAVLMEETPGRWKLTQALRADALPQHWKTRGNRVRLPADPLFDR